MTLPITIIDGIRIFRIIAAHPGFHPNKVGYERGNVAFENCCVASNHVFRNHLGFVILINNWNLTRASKVCEHFSASGTQTQTGNTSVENYCWWSTWEMRKLRKNNELNENLRFLTVSFQFCIIFFLLNTPLTIIDVSSLFISIVFGKPRNVLDLKTYLLFQV